MSKTGILLSIAVIAMLLFANLPAASAELHPKRTIEVTSYGLVYVYDEVPSAGKVTAIKFPKELVKNLVNYASPEDPNPELKVNDKTFSIVVDSKPGQVIHLTTIFRNAILWNPLETKFQLKIPMNPIMELKEKVSFTVTVKLPKDAEISKSEPDFLEQVNGSILSGVTENLDLSNENVKYVSITFSSNSLVVLDIVSSEMEVKPLEHEIGLTLKLRHLGGRTVNQLFLKLPVGSKIIETRDLIGRIPNKYSEEGVLRISLRQSLGFSRQDSVTVVFKVPENSSLIALNEGEGVITPILPMNTTAWIYDVKVILKDLDLESWNPEPEELRREYPNKIILLYRFSHVDPLNVKNFIIKLRYKPLFNAFTLMPYFLIIAIVGIIGSITALYVRKTGKKAATKERPASMLLDKVQVLASIYQELTDLIRSEKIFDKSRARKTLLEIRYEARREVEKVRKLGAEARGVEPEISRELDEFDKAVQLFGKTVEKAWNVAYPYLSGKLTRKKFTERIDKYYEDLKGAYDDLVRKMEDIEKKLR